MKVLQINSVIDYGSTGRITRDLYNYLESKGHDCLIAFGRGNSTPGYKTIKIGSSIDQKIHVLYSRLTDRHGFASKLATKKLIKQIESYNPDIIQLHNLHGYYINIEILFDYFSNRNTPIFWLLHDQWTISGHSANFNLNENGTIPDKLTNRRELKNYPRTIGCSQFEKNLKDKELLFNSVENMTIITPSKWLRKIIKKSYLNKYNIETIYNGIDTDVFKIEKSSIKVWEKKWSAENKTVILGIASVWDDRKGLNDFIELSKLLPDEKYQIVLVGIDEKIKKRLPNNIISINNTNSTEELRDIYNASDIFVNLTYFDNFPTVNIEALASGTPVITYDTGGSPESINNQTGSVVAQGDIKAIISEINKWRYKLAGSSYLCRDRVINKFSKNIAYNKYIKLYQKSLES